jgi:hypothetical protein
MQRTLLAVAAIGIISSTGLSATRAAELGARPALQRSASHSGAYAGFYGCTASYYCYPLYGAYGPFGGTPYWGAYTDAGWGYRRR